MSLESWEAEFYPTHAFNMLNTSAKKCVQHSLLKWRGATEENLQKHTVRYDDYDIEDLTTGETITFDGDSCALCQKFYQVTEAGDPCAACPVTEVIGQSCHEAWKKCSKSPLLMIKLLEKCEQAYENL